MPETLPRRGRMQGILEAPRKLAQTSHASKSLGNLAIATSQGGTLSRGISNTSLSSNGKSSTFLFTHDFKFNSCKTYGCGVDFLL